jgi:hypothetical protein
MVDTYVAEKKVTFGMALPIPQCQVQVLIRLWTAKPPSSSRAQQ